MGGSAPSVTYNPPPKDDSFARFLEYQQQKETIADQRAATERAEQKAAEAARKRTGAFNYAGLRSGIEAQMRQGLLGYETATQQLRDYATKYDLSPSDKIDLSSYVSKNKDIQDLVTEVRKEGLSKDEETWLAAANKQYGKNAKDLGEFSEQEIGDVHYNLYGKDENRSGVSFLGANPEQDIANLTDIYTKELLPGRRQTGIGAAYEEILGRQATEEEKTKATERFNQGYYTSNQDLRDALYKGTEYQKKFNQSYLDNYYDTKYGKQTVDEKGERTGQRTFKFSKELMPTMGNAQAGDLAKRTGITTPNFGDSFQGTPAELEEAQQNIRDSRQFLYSAGLTNLQGEIDKETQKLKTEGSKELAKIQSQGSIYNSLVGSFNF
jgi:hypothetical protein